MKVIIIIASLFLLIGAEMLLWSASGRLVTAKESWLVAGGFGGYFLMLVTIYGYVKFLVLAKTWFIKSKEKENPDAS